MGREYTSTLREGDQAPDFAVETSDGDMVRLRDFQGKSGVLLVFIRGTY